MRSATMATTTSSGHSSPRSMMSLALWPTEVPAFTAARSMSPVESWTMPYFSTSLCDCVPLPAPGGPSRISLMGVAPSDLYVLGPEPAPECPKRCTQLSMPIRRQSRMADLRRRLEFLERRLLKRCSRHQEGSCAKEPYQDTQQSLHPARSLQ